MVQADTWASESFAGHRLELVMVNASSPSGLSAARLISNRHALLLTFRINNVSRFCLFTNCKFSIIESCLLPIYWKWSD